MYRLLSQTAHTSIRKISPTRAVQKGIYRFLNNKKVTEEALIDELCNRYSSFAKDRHILCIQDTTEMNFFSQVHRIKDNTGLGRLDGAKPMLGFKMHSTLMLDALNGEILGFSDVHLWHRPQEMPNRRERKSKSLPIEEKESYKWIRAATKSKARLQEATMITFVEDREGDIYEQLSSIGGENAHYIIRSKNNRNTSNSSKVWNELEKQPTLGEFTLNLQTDHRKHRKKRKVTLKIRYAKVDITTGNGRVNGAAYPDKVDLNIVEAYEDREGGLSWKLLTTHPISNFGDAFQIVDWYSQRWTIEQVHRLLKNQGFQLEESELESGWAIRRLCLFMLSALLRIMQMNIAYNEPEGGQNIHDVYSDSEIECLKEVNSKIQGNTVKQQNLSNPETLKWATWVIARLGGWKAYHSQGPPGLIVLKRGLDKFYAIMYGWQMAKDVGTR